MRSRQATFALSTARGDGRSTWRLDDSRSFAHDWRAPNCGRRIKARQFAAAQEATTLKKIVKVGCKYFREANFKTLLGFIEICANANAAQTHKFGNKRPPARRCRKRGKRPINSLADFSLYAKTFESTRVFEASDVAKKRAKAKTSGRVTKTLTDGGASLRDYERLVVDDDAPRGSKIWTPTQRGVNKTSVQNAFFFWFDVVRIAAIVVTIARK